MTGSELRTIRELIDVSVRARFEFESHRPTWRCCPSCNLWRPKDEFSRDECTACKSSGNAIAHQRRKLAA